MSHLWPALKNATIHVKHQRAAAERLAVIWIRKPWGLDSFGVGFSDNRVVAPLTRRNTLSLA